MDRPPLIAHIIYALSTGGLENGLVNILNRFPEGRYRHVIICITDADDFARRITATDVDVIQMHKREGHDIRFYLQLRKLIKKLRPQIVHSRNLAALECQLCTLGLRGIRRIHGEHGREIGDLDGTNRKYLLLRRLMTHFVDRYIAVSRDLGAWLVDTVGVRPEKVTQIYNGVDHRRFSSVTVKPLALLPRHWQHLDDIVVIGTVGRLTPVKDQQTLLQAVSRVRETAPQLFRRLRLLLVGDGPLWGELQSVVAALELQEVVWFAGDRQDVPELLGLMDVFVLPSLGEGISNTALEAMSSGLPVVATRVGGNVELVRDDDNGALFGAGDSVALARILVALAGDSAQRRRLGARAREFVLNNFDWDRTVLEYLAVYDALSANRPALAGETAV